ncbi:MAG: insulinase family protein [Bacilli bacterium]|nr:insulinase family protein [Bacilli bacterium]
MNKVTIEKLDVDVYEEVLENGLKVFLCKIPRYSIHARLTSLFGGSILEFKLKGEKKYHKVPAGVAHFLEHKLFDKKDFDPLKIYENNGASGNAFTNEFITSYHFTGTDEFYDNLNTLFRCVHEPYFTDENVLKEKGIISQEKKEDMDSNYFIVYDRSLINVFHNLDFKNTVLGSLEDIQSISKEDLYTCYNTFYHPSNMILTICGDIDIDETMKFIKDYYSKKDFGPSKEIVIKKKEEPESVVVERDVINKDIQNKEVFITYKVKIPNKPDDKYLNKVYFSMLLDMRFSGLSELADITNTNSNFLSGISSRVIPVDDYYILSFGVTVKDDTEEAIKIIEDALLDFDFDSKRFNMIKKLILNSLILSFESPYEVCSTITNQVRLYGGIVTDIRSKLKSLDFDTFVNYIKHIDFSNRSVVILEKKAN